MFPFDSRVQRSANAGSISAAAQSSTMGNLSGTVAAVSTLFRPRILIPTLRVADIRALDWTALKRRGVNGVVLDKDNCLTKPLRDDLAPELTESWRRCLSTFGPSRVLLVSNSAGTADDPSLLAAESVSRSLGVPVLVHEGKKPSKGCAREVVRWFVSGGKGGGVVWKGKGKGREVGGEENRERLKLLVCGDRLTTDIILAHRLQHILSGRRSALDRLLSSLPGLADKSKGKEKEREDGQEMVVSVLTDRMLERERLGTRVMRWMEERMLRYAYWVDSRRRQRQPFASDASSSRSSKWRDCLLQPQSSTPPPAPALPPSSSGTRFSLPSPSTTSLPLLSSLATLPSFALTLSKKATLDALTFAKQRAIRLGGRLESKVRRWYEGGLGVGVRVPEGVRRLAEWKRLGVRDGASP